jgi:hypothetical protein
LYILPGPLSRRERVRVRADSNSLCLNQSARTS